MIDTAEVYGFNYDGSWAATGLELWENHDHGKMSVEISRGKKYFPEWNCCRWWLSWEAFQRSPQKFLENFEAGLGVFNKNGILVMPVLFNRWHDPTCDFGGVRLDHIIEGFSPWSRGVGHFRSIAIKSGSLVEELHSQYIEQVVGLHKNDSRIFCWDICNEPLMGIYIHDEESSVRAAEISWLSWVSQKVKACAPGVPITLGNYTSIKSIELTEPLVDIVSFHPYFMWNADPATQPLGDTASFERFIDDALKISERAGKKLIASETVWGARDDAKHVEVMRYTLSVLKSRNIGFLVHALHHSLVADLHRDGFGPVGFPECLHFIEADGSLREGHEAFREFAPIATARRT